MCASSHRRSVPRSLIFVPHKLRHFLPHNRTSQIKDNVLAILRPVNRNRETPGHFICSNRAFLRRRPERLEHSSELTDPFNCFIKAAGEAAKSVIRLIRFLSAIEKWRENWPTLLTGLRPLLEKWRKWRNWRWHTLIPFSYFYRLLSVRKFLDENFGLSDDDNQMIVKVDCAFKPACRSAFGDSNRTTPPEQFKQLKFSKPTSSIDLPKN